jgi:hypothetical protein
MIAPVRLRRKSARCVASPGGPRTVLANPMTRDHTPREASAAGHRSVPVPVDQERSGSHAFHRAAVDLFLTDQPAEELLQRPKTQGSGGGFHSLLIAAMNRRGLSV